MVEQLAGEYANQNVVFLEYDVDSAPSSRFNRWWHGFNGQSASLPLIMTDSGYEVHTGYHGPDQYAELKSMVDTSITRPAAADLSASWSRIGNRAHFSVTVTNHSGVTLSSNKNAAVHAIVYEDVQVHYTGRFVRSAVSTPIASLANGATGDFTLESEALEGVDWNKLHFIVLVDYLPGGTDQPYDMLQAALAQPMSVTPDELVFYADTDDATVPGQPVQLAAHPSAPWTSEAPPWISVSPASGTAATPPIISISPHLLNPGWQTGVVTFWNAGLPIDTVTVRAFLGETSKLYLPLTVK